MVLGNDYNNKFNALSLSEMTYSIDFRQQALSIKAQENLSFEAIAERVGVGKASVFRGSKQI